MAAIGEADFIIVRRVIKEFEEKRKKLEDGSRSRFARAFARMGDAVSSAMAEFSRDVYDSVSWHLTSEMDKMDLVMSKETSFMTACQEIVVKLDYLIEFYSRNPNVLDKEKFEPTKFQYTKREVIISFYGDSNAGKSTLLNCILGDTYLPSKQQSETAATIHIQFLDPRLSKYDSQDPWSMDNNEVLCVWNEKETVQARGQKEIHKAIAKINEQTREAKKLGRHVNSTYILKLKHSLGIARNEDRKFILFDNPGCDEYGSETVSSSTEMAKAVSSAFIFVTTIEGYTKLGSSGTLQSLFDKNPAILKQHRLTIIVNKMDSALEDKFGEDPSSKKEVVSNIRHFFCTKVFKINEKDLPQDSVVLVCGLWALIGRVYKNTQRRDVKKHLLPQITILRAISEFEEEDDLQDVKEDAHIEQANLLEKYSNIAQLEERLKMMSEKSSLFWKQKMRQDLKEHMSTIAYQLKALVAVEDEEIAELMKRVNQHYQAMQRLCACYADIMDNEKRCRKKRLPFNNKILVQLRDAYRKDMQSEHNLQARLKKDVDQKLQAFKMSTQDKINSKTHTNTILREDLKQLFEDVAGSMNLYRSCLENLNTAFQDANTDVQKETQTLKNTLSSLLNPNKLLSGEQVKSVKGSFGALPKLTGPQSEISLKIPLQLSSWQQFVKFWKKVFKMSLEEFKEPVFQANDMMFSNENFEETALNDSIPSSTEGDSQIESDGSTIETYYTRWSEELEAMKNNLQEEFYRDIQAFFDNADENIVLRCVEQHYEVAMSILKDFNEDAADEIEMCKHNLEQLMAAVEKKKKVCGVMSVHCHKVEYMNRIFECISQQEFKNVD